MPTMEWSRLLSTKRLGQEHVTPKEGRSDYNTDHDRIIFSSSFRRLQDKTQVFPLAETDYVRTRLTHSLEASNIGRTLGTLVGREIVSRNDFAAISEDDFGAIVATAALAHDLGNPPFGHSGEDAIRGWFAHSDAGRQVLTALSPEYQQDLLHFEGNAQGFRILTRLQYPDRAYGMRLTCAVLGAFMKYPCTASRIVHAEEGRGGYSKFGITVAEREIFAEVAHELGLIRLADGEYEWARHPLAYLVEAADDISYTIADIEDGFQRGCVCYDDVFSLLAPLITTKENWWHDTVRRMERDTERVEFLRAMAVGSVARSAVRCFLEHEETILAGEYLKGGLTKHMELKEPFSRVRIANRDSVYSDSRVVEIEAAGFEVMDRLLSAFGGALHREFVGKTTARDKTVCKLMPRRSGKPESLYEAMLEVTDFVSGMTDTSAVQLYKKLSGITLAKG